MKQNLKNGIAAQGYDVVSFFSGEPTKGYPSFFSTYNGAKYIFASLENKETNDN